VSRWLWPRLKITFRTGRSRTLTDHLERVRKAARKLTEDQRERDAAIIAAVKNGEPQADVARAADITRQRVGQIAAGIAAGPERALLTPEPGSTLTIAVVQKKDTDSRQPVIGTTTRKALDTLKDAAQALGITSGEEEIGPPGVIDLNRGNLAVMMGPRTSALIAQALSADPVIKWRQDSRERWYVTDTRTGAEYHSGYDDGWDGGAGGERECFAHIGRVRRPDGRGTFLYLGGAHSPGTAGAVAYFTREMPALWDQVHKSAWSAVVRTVTAAGGTLVSAELATPVYAHGRV
jgi:hypothetical protein